MELYWVVSPPASSCSASGKSNGSRFVSAKIAIMNTRNEMIIGIASSHFHGFIQSPTNGRINQPCSTWYCTTLVSRKLPTIRKTGMTASPSESSYEIICALERMPPRKGYFELDAQPPMTIPKTPNEEIANKNKIHTFTAP